MPAVVALPDDALWRPWTDLPLDLLREISRCLHTNTDYVRFHATCKPWRDSLLPATCYPAFLPWLLAPPDCTKHQKTRCIFSYSKSTRRGTGAATEIRFPYQRVVISLVDGTAVFTLTARFTYGSGTGGDSGGLSLVHLSGSAASAPVIPLLPLSPNDDETKWWADHAHGVVSSDGTILVCLIGPAPANRPYYVHPFKAALLRPGNAAWRMEDSFPFDKYSSIAYHDGMFVVRSNFYLSWFWVGRWKLLDLDRWDTQSLSESGKALLASYLLESRGELLLVNVLANDVLVNDCPQDYRHTIASFVDRLSASVYAVQETEGGEKQWVKRDGRSFTDRVMFLGRPSSFAVDAAQFGVIVSGGCAYFVLKNCLCGSVLSKFDIKRCRVFKYSFQDDRSELIEQLPAEWDNDACKWLTPPQPSICSTEEIREKLESSHTKGPKFGPYFRIYVGNLSRNVDSYRLREFFGKYGKVAEARVMCDIKTKHSRGFGFVTLATVVDLEHEHAITMMDGQILERRPLRVELADQKHPLVAC